MKRIFIGPNGIRAGWRFVIFVFLLFGFSKLFFWTLTTVLHYQEPEGWFAKNFAIEGGLSFGAALLAAWIMSKIERRPFREYGLARRGAFGRHFWQGLAWGLGASVVMIVLLSIGALPTWKGWRFTAASCSVRPFCGGLRFSCSDSLKSSHTAATRRQRLRRGWGFGAPASCCPPSLARLTTSSSPWRTGWTL